MIFYLFLCEFRGCSQEQILTDLVIWFFLTIIFNIIIEIKYFLEREEGRALNNMGLLDNFFQFKKPVVDIPKAKEEQRPFIRVSATGRFVTLDTLVNRVKRIAWTLDVEIQIVETTDTIEEVTVWFKLYTTDTNLLDKFRTMLL